jgi:hypothetical protein
MKKDQDIFSLDRKVEGGSMNPDLFSVEGNIRSIFSQGFLQRNHDKNQYESVEGFV